MEIPHVSAADSAVLLVDDRPENLLALDAIFADTGIVVVTASSGAEALRLLLVRDFACVVLDVFMPGIDGFEVASLIKQRDRTRLVPILFLTATTFQPEAALRGYELGAVDYLEKPVEPTLLRAKVSVFVQLHRQRLQLEKQAILLRSAADDRQKRLLAETQQHHEERARKAAEETLRLREEFLTVAAHEFKTPLTALNLAVQQLRRDGALTDSPPHSGPSPTAEMVEIIERQTSRLALLLDQLIEGSDAGTLPLALELDDVDLAPLVRDAVTRSHAEAERAGSEMTVTAETQSRGRFDAIRIERVFNNLLGNAIRFGAGKPIDVALDLDAGAARIRVRDRGIGIEPRDLDRIFGRFERAVSARAYGGFGLGLYLSRRIIEAHGGTIAVESEHGGGSVFTVRLPIG